MRDYPPPWHKPNLGRADFWPRLSVEVCNDGSLAVLEVKRRVEDLLEFLKSSRLSAVCF
jgi:hypothetical protein